MNKNLSGYWDMNVLKKYATYLFTIFTISVESLTSQPSVQTVSGEFIHESSILIQGNGFGSKNPAAPFLWDACKDSLDILTHYVEALPSNAQQGSYYNTKYRSLPFRTINAPNSHITYIIGGAHATNSSSGQYPSGNNVSILISGINSATVPTTWNWYLQHWYRVDPDFAEVNNPAGENCKLLCLSGDPNQIYGSNYWGYAAYCGGTVPDVNYLDSTMYQRAGVDGTGGYACSGNYLVNHANPIIDWVKFEWLGGYNYTYDNPTWEITTYPDHKRTYRTHTGVALSTYEILYGIGFPNVDALRSIAIGGFARVPRTDNGVGAFRYFAGVYFDTVQARVMLGDQQNYDLCTIMEPQIPSTWSQNSITATANLGSLPDTGIAYLFVFDKNNVHNSMGFPVTIGGGTPNEPPEKPQNIRITP